MRVVLSQKGWERVTDFRVQDEDDEILENCQHNTFNDVLCYGALDEVKSPSGWPTLILKSLSKFISTSNSAAVAWSRGPMITNVANLEACILWRETGLVDTQTEHTILLFHPRELGLRSWR